MEDDLEIVAVCSYPMAAVAEWFGSTLGNTNEGA